MRNDTWLEQLALELTARSVPTEERVSIIVEVQGHLEESEASAVDAFGLPAAYAEHVASVLVESRAPRHDGPVRVVVDGVRKRFRQRPVLDGVDLEVQTGEVVALIGPNGCGKSTLLRLVAGLERPDAGFVSVDGAIGYAPQDGGLSAYLRPVEHFELFGAARGLPAADARREGKRLARELGWDAAAAPIARDLSGGTRQKLSVTLALLGQPPILLLDEPYQGLDLPSTQRFWELLWDWGERGGSALVVSHTHDVLSRASRVVELPMAAAA